MVNNSKILETCSEFNLFSDLLFKYSTKKEKIYLYVFLQNVILFNNRINMFFNSNK